MTERELDAISRLAAWQRDYGDKCTQVFNDDLRTVLSMVAEIERLRELYREARAALWKYDAQDPDIFDAATEAALEKPCKA
jgi:hypothetical protein